MNKTKQHQGKKLLYIVHASSIKYTEGIYLGYYVYFVIISDTMCGPGHTQDNVAAHKSK